LGAAYLACVLVLVAVASGCSLGSSSNSSVGKADPNTTINVDGVVGGIRARDTRVAVEKRLGAGTTISASTHKQKIGGTYTLTRVRYPASQLVVLYVASPGRPPWVFGVFTTSPRYHTADGLRVGSTLAQAQHEPGIRCYDQQSYFACQGGLGYQKPITSFTVRSGKVVRVFMAAFAD
jgi:hypothetical protein